MKPALKTTVHFYAATGLVGVAVVMLGLSPNQVFNAQFTDPPEYCQGEAYEVPVAHGEKCYDTDKTDGDGCSASCIVEEGWYCHTTYNNQQCLPIGGDGLIRGRESCDDGNRIIGDGCSPYLVTYPSELTSQSYLSTCTVDEGWRCKGEPSSCEILCGDMKILYPENCDDGNIVDDGNGCSTSCSRNDRCGDGTKQSLYETCDDGNTADGEYVNGILVPDYCDSTCAKATGFCGDGVRQASAGEECDNGGSPAQDHDGCSAKCTVEKGWECGDRETPGITPNGYMPANICRRICGDGLVQYQAWQYDQGFGSRSLGTASEACDDGNTTPGDGCTKCDEGGCYPTQDYYYQTNYFGVAQGQCYVEAGCTCTGEPSVCTCPSSSAPSVSSSSSSSQERIGFVGVQERKSILRSFLNIFTGSNDEAAQHAAASVRPDFFGDLWQRFMRWLGL